MISQFPGTLKTNGEVMLLLLAQVFPLSENEINHIVLVYCSSLKKITEVLLYVVFFFTSQCFTHYYITISRFLKNVYAFVE
jgi:hypothetical protein